MKLKNGILGLLLFGTLLAARPAHAVIFPDQTAGNFGESEDENSDAVSRFGFDVQKKKKADTKSLDPISEASFPQEHSRSPASVIEGGSRGPATVPHSSKNQAINQAKRAKSYQEIAVIANDTGFYPSTVFLTQGIPVRIYITGASAKSQCFMLDQFGVRRQIRSQKIEEITFIPDQVGTFTFSCPMNGAKGNVIVKELELTERLPASVAVAVSQARDSAPEARPVEAAASKKSEINEDDFTPEFRRP